MSPDLISTFTHLFSALSAGCPPHAGFAIGFDRLIAMMRGRDSVRDVIAFPKDKRGADPMLLSPSPLTKAQREMYHIPKKAHRKGYEDSIGLLGGGERGEWGNTGRGRENKGCGVKS